MYGNKSFNKGPWQSQPGGNKRSYQQAFESKDQETPFQMTRSLMGKVAQNMINRGITIVQLMKKPRGEIDAAHQGIITKYEKLREKLIEIRPQSRQYLDKPFYLDMKIIMKDMGMYIICTDQDEEDHLLIEDTTPVTCQKDFDQYLTALEGIFVKKERILKEKEFARELGLDDLFAFKRPKLETIPEAVLEENPKETEEKIDELPKAKEEEEKKNL